MHWQRINIDCATHGNVLTVDTKLRRLIVRSLNIFLKNCEKPIRIFTVI